MSWCTPGIRRCALLVATAPLLLVSMSFSGAWSVAHAQPGPPDCPYQTSKGECTTEPQIPDTVPSPPPQRLVITSDPTGARVFIGRTDYGVTPVITKEPIKAGTYTIRLELASHVTVTDRVVVKKHGIQVFQFKLQAFPQFTIRLDEASRGGSPAEVYVDRNYHGEVSDEPLVLPPGPHTIVIKKDDYFDWEKSISIFVGDDREIEASLRTKDGTLSIDSNLVDVLVYRHPVEICSGKGPGTLYDPIKSETELGKLGANGLMTRPMKPARYCIELHVPRLGSYFHVVEVAPGANSRVDLRVGPPPKPPKQKKLAPFWGLWERDKHYEQCNKDFRAKKKKTKADCFRLGMSYLTLSPVDEVRAKEMLKNACFLGQWPSCEVYGWLLRHGRVSRLAGEDQGKRRYDDACKHGEQTACFRRHLKWESDRQTKPQDAYDFGFRVDGWHAYDSLVYMPWVSLRGTLARDASHDTWTSTSRLVVDFTPGLIPQIPVYLVNNHAAFSIGFELGNGWQRSDCTFGNGRCTDPHFPDWAMTAKLKSVWSKRRLYADVEFKVDNLRPNVGLSVGSRLGAVVFKLGIQGDLGSLGSRDGYKLFLNIGPTAGWIRAWATGL